MEQCQVSAAILPNSFPMRAPWAENLTGILGEVVFFFFIFLFSLSVVSIP